MDAGTEPVEIDFTPPFKRMYMFPALEEALSVKLPSATELASSESNKLLEDLCLKHEIECPPPRTSARLLDKVKFNLYFIIVNNYTSLTFLQKLFCYKAGRRIS